MREALQNSGICSACQHDHSVSSPRCKWTCLVGVPQVENHIKCFNLSLVSYLLCLLNIFITVYKCVVHVNVYAMFFAVLFLSSLFM